MAAGARRREQTHIKRTKMQREIPLFVSGKPCACIVTPEGDDDLYDQGGLISAFLEDIHGIELPVLTCDEHAGGYRTRKFNVIALGDFSSNRVLRDLYVAGRHYVDRRFPGGRGHVVRTICDPGSEGRSYVVIGGSTPAGLQNAVHAFCELLVALGSRRNIPPTHLCVCEHDEEYALGAAELSERIDRGLEALSVGDSASALDAAADAAVRYDVSGVPTWARLFASILEAYAEASAEAGTPAVDASFDAARWLWRLVPIWDNIAEFGAFSDAERDLLGLTLHSWSEWLFARMRAEAPSRSGSGPGTWRDVAAGLGLVAAGRYFRTYYHVMAGREWVELGKAWIESASRAGRLMAECALDECRAMDMTLSYALRYQGGLQADEADLLLFRERMLMALAAEPAPAAPSVSTELEQHVGAVLRKAVFVTQSKRLRGETLGNATVLGGFHEDEPEAAPVRPRPPLAIPVSPKLRPWLRAQWPTDAGPTPASPFFERLFDQLAFRAGSRDGEDEFLSIHGLRHPGAPTCPGAFAVWRRGQHEVLGQGDDGSPFPHSGLEVLREGRFAPPPPAAGLESAERHEGLAACSLTVPNYNGVEWRRHSFWFAGRGLVVLDQIQAQVTGVYDLRVHYRLANPVEVHGASARTRGGPNLTLDLPAGGAWTVLDAGGRCLAAELRADLAEGQGLVMATVAAWLQPGGLPSLRVEPASAVAFLVHGLSADPVVVGLPPAEWAAVEVECDARAYALTKDLLYVLGAARFGVGPSYVEASSPSDMVYAPGPGRISVSSFSGGPLFVGLGSRRFEARVERGHRWESDLTAPRGQVRQLRAAVVEQAKVYSPPWLIASGQEGRPPRAVGRAVHERWTLDEPVADAVEQESSLWVALPSGQVAALDETGTRRPIASVPAPPTRLAAAGGTVVVGMADGRVWCLADGEPQWEFSCPAYRGQGSVTAVLASGDESAPLRATIGTAGGLVMGLDARGDPIWARDLGLSSVRGLVALPSPIGGLLLCWSAEGVWALAPASGRAVWTEPADDRPLCGVSVVPGGSDWWQAIVADAGGRIRALGPPQERQSVSAGVAWEANAGGVTTGVVPVVSGRQARLAVAATSGWLVRLELDGAEVGRTRLGSAIVGLAPVSGGRVLTLSADGVVHLVGWGGEVVGRTELGRRWSGCCVAGGRVFGLGPEGLACLEPV